MDKQMLDGKAIGVVADVCSLEDTQKVFVETIKEFGDLDILINNAGIGEQKMIDETDDEWMMHMMNAGAVITNRERHSKLRKAGYSDEKNIYHFYGICTDDGSNGMRKQKPDRQNGLCGLGRKSADGK